MKFLKFGRKINRKQTISTISTKVLYGRGGKFNVSKSRLKLRVEIFFRRNFAYIKNFFLIFLLFVAIYAIYNFFINTDFFKVRNIAVEGTKTYVSSSDLKSLVENKYSEHSLFFLNTNDVKRTTLENFLGAKDAVVVKKLPNTLIIKLEERYPVAILRFVKSDEKFLIDKDGYILGLAGENFSSFPSIDYDNEIHVGQFIDADVIPLGLKVIEETQKKELKLSSMSFSERYIKFYINNGAEVYLGRDKDVERSAKSISAIVKNAALEGKKLKKIDLRYDKVIVLYE